MLYRGSSKITKTGSSWMTERKIVISSGLLMFRVVKGELEFFLGHPGGPYYAEKDKGVWSIPKGVINDGESLILAAKREFREETGIHPVGPYLKLGESFYHKRRKIFYCFAFHMDFAGVVRSNECEIEYPLKSGKKMTIPEINRAQFFQLKEACTKIHPYQLVFVNRLQQVSDKMPECFRAAIDLQSSLDIMPDLDIVMSVLDNEFATVRG